MARRAAVPQAFLAGESASRDWLFVRPRVCSDHALPTCGGPAEIRRRTEGGHQNATATTPPARAITGFGHSGGCNGIARRTSERPDLRSELPGLPSDLPGRHG